MTTRELMIFKVKCKGRYRMTTNDDVKSVSIIKKDGVVQAKVIGNIGEVIYNYDMSIANIMGGKILRLIGWMNYKYIGKRESKNRSHFYYIFLDFFK